MNQNRISWIFAIAIAVCFIGSGTLFALWQTTTTIGYGAFLFSLVFLFLGMRELHTLMQQVNTWQFNVTPHDLKHAPQGSWAVISAGIYRHNPQDDAVYVTIAKTPACDRALSALRLPSEWIDIRDYQAIVKGRQPLGVSIGDRVTFTWE